MKHWRVLLQYYKDQLPFSLGLFFVVWIFSSLIWAAVFFVLLGGLIGNLGFYQFYSIQLYTYYNLGFTRQKLVLIATLYNALLLLPLTIIATLVYVVFL